MIGRLVQIVAGVIAGVIAVWALWQMLPFRTGTGVFIGSVVLTLGIAITVGYFGSRFRTGAIAFAVAATALNGLLALVVL